MKIEKWVQKQAKKLNLQLAIIENNGNGLYAKNMHGYNHNLQMQMQMQMQLQAQQMIDPRYHTSSINYLRNGMAGEYIGSPSFDNYMRYANNIMPGMPVTAVPYAQHQQLFNYDSFAVGAGNIANMQSSVVSPSSAASVSNIFPTSVNNYQTFAPVSVEKPVVAHTSPENTNAVGNDVEDKCVSIVDDRELIAKETNNYEKNATQILKKLMKDWNVTLNHSNSSPKQVDANGTNQNETETNEAEVGDQCEKQQTLTVTEQKNAKLEYKHAISHNNQSSNLSVQSTVSNALQSDSNSVHNSPMMKIHKLSQQPSTLSAVVSNNECVPDIICVNKSVSVESPSLKEKNDNSEPVLLPNDFFATFPDIDIVPASNSVANKDLSVDESKQKSKSIENDLYVFYTQIYNV